VVTFATVGHADVVSEHLDTDPRRTRIKAWRDWAAAQQQRLEASFIGMSWRRAAELNLPTHSLALAAQQILCTAPLLVAFSVVRRNAETQNIGEVLTHYLALTPAASRDVGSLFHNSQAVTRGDRILGLLLALVFATAIAATQQRWFELVWSQSRAPMLRSVLRQVAWVAGLCAYLVIVLYAGRAGHGVGQHVHAGRPAGPLVQFGVSLLFFWWSQHLLLGGRLAWRRLLPGAIGMAAGMTALVGLSGYAMSSEIVAEDADYGLIGSTFVLSLWLVALSGLLCGAALLGELISEHRVRQNNA
jgi:membrane protein